MSIFIFTNKIEEMNEERYQYISVVPPRQMALQWALNLVDAPETITPLYALTADYETKEKIILAAQKLLFFSFKIDSVEAVNEWITAVLDTHKQQSRDELKPVAWYLKTLIALLDIKKETHDTKTRTENG